MQQGGAHEEMDGLSHLRDNGIQLTVFDSTAGLLNPLRGRGSLLAGIDPWRFLRLVVNFFRWDVLISVDSSSCFLFVQLKRLLRLKKPVVVIDPALGDGYPNRTRVHDQVLPYVDTVVVFGRVQEQHLKKRYGDRVRAVFLPHRMDTAFFDPAKAAKTEQGGDYVLSIGADVGRDFSSLAKAAEGLGHRVVIHSTKALDAVLPEGVQLRKDWVSFEELRDLYAGAGVVAVPLRRTTHASGINALLEAMSMGKAVVVSDSPGVADYVRHGETAWVVESGNPERLREALKTLQEDRGMAARLGENARRYCEMCCAMPVYAKSLARVVRRACGAQPGSDE